MEENNLSSSVVRSLRLRCYEQLDEIDKVLQDGVQIEDATLVAGSASALTEEYYEEVAKVV
jgi:hypothetical protein